MAHGRVNRSPVPSYAHLHRHAAAHRHASAAILVIHSTPDARLIPTALLHPAHIQDNSGQNKHRRKNVDHIRASPTENVQDEYCQYSCTDKQYSKVIFEETFHHTYKLYAAKIMQGESNSKAGKRSFTRLDAA